MTEPLQHDRRGILVMEQDFPIHTSLLPNDPAAAEYAGSHDITAILRVRWQWQITEPASRYRLVDWSVVGLTMNGHALQSDADIPSDFPMQQIVNALHRREVRELLESNGPKARRTNEASK